MPTTGNVIALLVVLVSCSGSPTHRTDEQLRSIFEEQRTKIDSIARFMASNPDVVNISAEGLRTAWEGPGYKPGRDARWQSVWPLVSAITAREVTRRASGDVIVILDESAESAKGFELFTSATLPSTQILDATRLECGELQHSSLTGKWFLYLQSYCS